MKKNVYVVLGMSRTGTSAIARSLEALGIMLGKKLIVADERNPKGFYEDIDVLYKINRGMSRAIEHQWLLEDSSASQLLLADPHVLSFKQLAVTLVKNRLASADDWGFKDPRTDELLPFWASVFSEADVCENYIIALRNPLATAYSNQKFTGIDIEAGLLLWLRHMMAIIDGTIGKKRVVIAYEVLMQSPRQQVERLHQALSLSSPLCDRELTRYADKFLDSKLNHHQYSQEECERHPAMKIAPLCLRMYALLMRAATDDVALDSDNFIKEWQKIKDDYAIYAPLYHYIDTLLAKNKEWERTVRGIRKAWSWKLIAPFRMVEQVWRSQRRLRKEKSRLCLTK